MTKPQKCVLIFTLLAWPLTFPGVVPGQVPPPPASEAKSGEAGAPGDDAVSGFPEELLKLLDKHAQWIFGIIAVAVAAFILQSAITKGITAALEKALAKPLEPLGKVEWSVLVAQTGSDIKDLLEPEIRDISQVIQRRVTALGNLPVGSDDRESGQSIFVPRTTLEADEIGEELKQVDEQLEAGNREQAYEHLRQIRDRFPADFRSYGKQVQHDLDANKAQQARDFLLEHADQFPQNPDYFRFLGVCYRRLDAFDKALGSNRKAVELRPDDHAMRMALAFNYWKLDRLREAIGEIEQALSLGEGQGASREDLANIQNSLAYYLAERGDRRDKDRAKGLIEEALCFATLPAFQHTKGFVLLRFGKTTANLEAAIEAFQEALRLGSDPTVGTDHLRRAYERRNELAAAAPALT